jgi:hypothetical protein
MKKEKNYERLRLLTIAAAILAIGSSAIAIITAEPRASAHTYQSLALIQRACVVYQTYPATAHCSMPIGPSTFKIV